MSLYLLLILVYYLEGSRNQVVEVNAVLYNLL